MSSVYGMTMAVANERWFGTLGPLLASPANRAAVFLGRGLPVLANGLLVSAFTFGAGVAPARLPARARRRCPRSRVVVARDGRVVHRVRDAARLDRPAREGLLLRREPRVLPDAALLRRQHPALRAARLDERDLALPAADARDRRRARGRGRSVARRRRRPGLDRARRSALATRRPAFALFRMLERESRRSAVLDAY